MPHFAHMEDEYRTWIDDNPAGYVLVSHNPPSPRYVTIHRASCSHINPAKAPHKANWTKKYIKVCEPTREGLNRWMSNQWPQANPNPLICSRCKP